MDNFWTWTRNGTPIVTTPEGVDIANDGVLRERLLDASARNPVVVVDANTFWTFLGVSAMRVLDEAGRRMASAGGELRLFIGRPDTPRCLKIVRYDQHVRIFENLTEALNAPLQGWESQSHAA